MKKVRNIVLALTMLSGAGAIHAEEAGFYAGAKLGGYTVDDVGSYDFSELAWGAYGGYRFNEYISAEAEYVSLEEDKDAGISLEGDLWALSVRPTLPLNDDWELFVKAGWGWLDAKASGFGVSASDTDDDFIWGLGATFFGEGFHVRGEVQADDDVPDFLIYTIGVGVDF